MQVVIGFDTSCYTTSAAAYDVEEGRVFSQRRLLPVAVGERGLRQSEAVFAHVRQIPEVTEQLFSALSEYEICGVCASATPRDDETSYMPVFTVGMAHARALAAALRVPLYQTTHQRGHVRAAMLGTGFDKTDFLAVHLSGGTTEVLHMKDDALTLLGGTKDLHAGQLVDRTGVALGLRFPCGPYLEEMAVRGQAKQMLPTSVKESDCHLSGAETQVQAWIRSGKMTHEDIAAEVYSLIARTVLKMLVSAVEQTGTSDVLIAGGVASSELLRKMIAERNENRRLGLHIAFGQPCYSGDNAAGVAALGAEKYLRERKG